MSKNPRELFGESIFTSFRSINGAIYGLDYHVERILGDVIDYYLSSNYSVESLSSYFKLKIKLLILAKVNQNHYFRVSIFNKSRTELVPKHFGISDLDLAISIEKLPKSNGSISLKTFLSPYSENLKTIKSGSYFQNLYFRRLAFKEGFDDALFVRSGILLEASTSNLVLIKNNKIYFMKAKGIFPGVTQKLINDCADKLNMKVSYEVVRVKDLAKFEAAALVNSVQLISPIYKINDINYNVNQALLFKENFLKVLQDQE
jgi:D-alanine transaminase